MNMNSRETFLRTAEHRETDNLVLDFGATALTGIHVQTISRLRRHYGLLRNPIRIIEPFQMLGEVGWEMADSIGIDVLGAWNKNNVFGFGNHAPFKEWKTPWGQRVMVPFQFQTSKDSNGDILIHPQGDLTQAACAKMQKDGFSFEKIGSTMAVNNPDVDLEHWQVEVDKAYYSGKAVVADFGITTPELVEGLVNMSVQDVETHLEKEADLALAKLEKIFGAVGNKVNAVLFCKSSFTTTPRHSEELDGILFPYYQKLNDWIHDNTSWRTMKHSGIFTEGSTDRIVRAGFDILHLPEGTEEPDAAKLKKAFGRDLIFWGGGIDAKQTLLNGSKQQVREQILKRSEILSKNGGFIFSASGNIPANVPIENFVAMLDAIREFNRK